jgi:hypothetical protein
LVTEEAKEALLQFYGLLPSFVESRFPQVARKKREKPTVGLQALERKSFATSGESKSDGGPEARGAEPTPSDDREPSKER